MRIYWDIDGTLLNTGSSGERAIEAMCKEQNTNRPQGIRITDKGKTDWYIGYQQYISIYNTVPSHRGLSLFMDDYEQRLMRELASRVDVLNPNVESILQERCGVTHCLFTGNRQSGAKKKLEACHIHTFFDWEHSVFGEERRTKLEAWQEKKGELKSSIVPIIVVGDTAYDMKCAKRVGAIAIGVLTGSSSRSEMEESAADIIWRELPSGDVFFQTLEQLWKRRSQVEV